MQCTLTSIIMSELCIDNLTVCYDADPAIHHLSLQLPFGALVALLGPNGAGKSTLMRAILGWQPATTGSVTVDGKLLDKSSGRITYVPQRRDGDADFPIHVRAVVETGRYASLGWFRRFSEADHRAVDEALAEMGLERLQDRPLATLSGGQLQRVYLARALASGSDIFLLDEPFAGLDAAAVSALVRSLRRWSERGRLVISVVHDLDLVRRSFTHAVLMRNHLIACGSPPEVLCDEHLRAAFGNRQLAGAEGLV
jgi:manganese/zinc/iron transport system ATP- binding protein